MSGSRSSRQYHSPALTEDERLLKRPALTASRERVAAQIARDSADKQEAANALHDPAMLHASPRDAGTALRGTAARGPSPAFLNAFETNPDGTRKHPSVFANEAFKQSSETAAPAPDPGMAALQSGFAAAQGTAAKLMPGIFPGLLNKVVTGAGGSGTVTPSMAKQIVPKPAQPQTRTNATGGTETLMPSASGPRWVQSTAPGSAPPINNMNGEVSRDPGGRTVARQMKPIAAPLTDSMGTRATDAANLAQNRAMYAPGGMTEPAGFMDPKSWQASPNVFAAAGTGQNVAARKGDVAFSTPAPPIAKAPAGGRSGSSDALIAAQTAAAAAKPATAGAQPSTSPSAAHNDLNTASDTPPPAPFSFSPSPGSAHNDINGASPSAVPGAPQKPAVSDNPYLAAEQAKKAALDDAERQRLTDARAAERDQEQRAAAVRTTYGGGDDYGWWGGG